ncbi:MAG: SDR family NAD(P)-dependent oxidoreductase [Pseudomonadales bacterium]
MSEESRVAVVAGAASGIGRSAVELFLCQGSKVVAMDRSNESLGWAKDHANADVVQGDVATQIRTRRWRKLHPQLTFLKIQTQIDLKRRTYD